MGITKDSNHTKTQVVDGFIVFGEASNTSKRFVHFGIGTRSKSIRYYDHMKGLLLAPFLLLFPLTAFAVPENPDQFKKLEEAFILPCDEIGSDAELMEQFKEFQAFKAMMANQWIQSSQPLHKQIFFMY